MQYRLSRQVNIEPKQGRLAYRFGRIRACLEHTGRAGVVVEDCVRSPPTRLPGRTGFTVKQVNRRGHEGVRDNRYDYRNCVYAELFFEVTTHIVGSAGPRFNLAANHLLPNSTYPKALHQQNSGPAKPILPKQP